MAEAEGRIVTLVASIIAFMPKADPVSRWHEVQ